MFDPNDTSPTIMFCPRCSAENTITQDFCVYCGWDFASGWRLCSLCNQTLKGDEACELCEEE